MMTFWLLIVMFGATAPIFRTAWFIESLLSELLFTLSMRTQRPFWRSKPSRSLALLSLGIAALALAMPWLPVAGILGFVPLPVNIAGALAAVLVLYLALTDFSKTRLAGATGPGRTGRRR
jgi:Mg2+-importing ATPase